MIKRSANCIAQSNQILCCEFHCSNKTKQQHLHVPQPIGTTPLTLRHARAHTHAKHIQPTCTLEGVRACGEAVPGRHSRLRQSDPSAHPEVTCKGTTTIKVNLVEWISSCKNVTETQVRFPEKPHSLLQRVAARNVVSYKVAEVSGC